MQLDGKTPSGPLQNKWDKYRFETKLVNPWWSKYNDVVDRLRVLCAAVGPFWMQQKAKSLRLCRKLLLYTRESYPHA